MANQTASMRAAGSDTNPAIGSSPPYRPASVDRRTFLQVLGLLGLGSLAVAAAEQVPIDVAGMQRLLDRQLPAAHPRLHLNGAGWDDLRRRIATDDLLREWHHALTATAERMLQQPLVEYRLDGPRLLERSREALHLISTLAALYRLDGDRRYADRARAELRAICAFPSWHPPHFLDVAEMTNAAGLGYDWLHDVMPDEERQLLRGRILEFGLRPGLAEYERGTSWSRPGANNWGQVCAGGLTIGALAIAGDGPTAMTEPAAVLRWTVSTVPYAMASYAPDGGWPEGPGYWAYATNYTCSMLSALRSALATDFALSELPGFSETGSFRVASIGPSGQFFNYADGASTVGRAPEMLWLARHFGQPLYAVSEHTQVTHTGPDIFHLVWSQPGESGLTADAPPLDIRFTRIDLAFFRSFYGPGPAGSNALFLGIKGGTNGISHAHLDLGSFVLDALGERWALDLGPDDYNLPEYFGSLRWNYYRLRTEGHNTLTFGTQNQNTKAHAALSGFTSTPAGGQATIDLTDAYLPALRRATRGVALERGAAPRVVMRDRLEGGLGMTIRWSLHTDAAIELDGAEAVLSKNGKRLRVRATAPSGLLFASIAATAPPPQRQQPDVRVLILECPLSAGTTELVVSMEPMT